MNRYFGTDGIRGKLDDVFTIDFLVKFANAISNLKPYAKILIGTDTRESKNVITLSLISELNRLGLDVVFIGVCPTAGVSYLTNKHNFDLGIVVSASHNPFDYNGLKIFDSSGNKIDNKTECLIEYSIINYEKKCSRTIGKYKFYPGLKNSYYKFLKNSISNCLKSKKIVLDCANGSAYKIAPKVFKECGAELVVINNNPDGKNINDKCGATNIHQLKMYVQKHNADFGFAFDGDSDRLIAIDEKGNTLDGDDILYIFSINYLKNNKKTVVSTNLLNLGVEDALKRHNILVLKTDIGDKNVLNCINKNDLILGSEQSGHIIINDKLSTGDGILNALILSEIVVQKQCKLSDLIDYKKYFQKCINIKTNYYRDLLANERILEFIRKIENKIGTEGRILVRASGTEPVIRIMVETKQECLANKICDDIASYINLVIKEKIKCVE